MPTNPVRRLPLFPFSIALILGCGADRIIGVPADNVNTTTSVVVGQELGITLGNVGPMIMSRRSADVPNLVVAPPVLVGSTLLLGLCLHYFVWPITPLPIIPARIVGLVIFVASGVLAHTAHRAMQRAGTDVLPTRPTRALALDGPYRRTRNPLYLAALGVALGVCLWIDGVVPLLLLLPMSGILHVGIVLREEAYLLAKFGAQYEAYRQAVPRWL